MKRLAFYFFLLAICFAGCKQRSSEVQEISKNSNDTILLINRVEMMYNEIFSLYNKSDFAMKSDVEKKFFSERLKALWETLPTDEMVINADPWTWMAEPDSFVYQGGEVKRLDKETAEVLVTIQGFERPYNDRINQRTVMLVREGGDWFIDDFRDKNRKPYSSLLHEIQDYNREHEACQRIKGIYNEVVTRYNKGEDFDGDSCISTKLRNLWEKLPKDEKIYHFNVWTGVQEFDSLLCPLVYLESERNGGRYDEQRKDTVIVTINIRPVWVTKNTNPLVKIMPKKNEIYVRAVYEKGDWYIDDIVHKCNGEEYSIQKIVGTSLKKAVSKILCK